MMTQLVLCTLFNSLYLDKGLVLYDSLCHVSDNFLLYILCMDEKCYKMLEEQHFDKIRLIQLSDIEDKEMLMAKSNRTMAEYCWTCSSKIVQYILGTYKYELCTYIDADMCFYHDPQVLIDEMLNFKSSVQIIPHRFLKENQKLAKTVGEYCVEFNTFRNDYNGWEVLNYWHNRCIGCCRNLGDGIHWGDQKYLEELVNRFSTVHICTNPGAGIAPWNVAWYRKVRVNKEVFYKKNEKVVPVIFYHFQSIKYISRNQINIGILARQKNIDYNLVDSFYIPYLKEIELKKQYLQSKYHIANLLMYHPSDNKIKSRLKLNLRKLFIFKYMMAFKRKMMNKPPYIIDIKSKCPK